ncbi:MAG: chalcone isomerase family protein [Burkholderiales bacterium]|nr:chalcone isomerase family protein [Burkholderiales bacterium]
MKSMFALALTALSLVAGAVDINGVKVDEAAKVAGQDLVLDGGGVRYKFGFVKVYVGALYSVQKSNSADAVINDGHPRRISMTMLRHLPADKLHESLIEGLQENSTEAELTAMQPKIKQLNSVFQSVKDVDTGDVILLDFLPGKGTQISVRGQIKDVIAGDDFAKSLLKVWLGHKPVSADLKAAMLGAK